MSSHGKPSSRIVIIGLGQVGTAAAYAIILNSLASELLLVDIKTDLRNCQVNDLSDASYSCNSKTRVLAATHQEARDTDIILLRGHSIPEVRSHKGEGRKLNHMRCNDDLGETSVQHIYKKVSIILSIINEMRPFRSDTILLIVANPVDLLTSLAHEISGLPACQVLRSGTFLDLVRHLLAETTAVAANSIDLYVVGVYGDSQVVAWSDATIADVPINKPLPISTMDYDRLSNECKCRSRTIIQEKRSTPLGIGSVLSSICSSILSDKRNVRPISHFQPEWGCCFSLPVVLGRTGIIKKIHDPLTNDERAALDEPVKDLRTSLEKINENQSVCNQD